MMIPLDKYIELAKELQKQLNELCPLLKFEVWSHDRVKIETLEYATADDPYQFEYFICSSVATINGVRFSARQTEAEYHLVGKDYKTGDLVIMSDAVEHFIIIKSLRELSKAILEWRPEQGK